MHATDQVVVFPLKRQPVVIGSRYTTKYAGHLDREHGVYWERNAPIVDDMRLLQLALTAGLLEQASERVARNVKALRSGKP